LVSDDKPLTSGGKALKTWAKLIFMMTTILITHPLFAQHILQGQLFSTEDVEFELIDGFAFQNSILVRLQGEPYGHFNGTVGMRASKMQSLINELNQAKEQGGQFYLPMGAQRQRGTPTVQSIVHFPNPKDREPKHNELSQCAPLIKEHQARINKVFQKFKNEHKLEQGQLRAPASLKP
jgi:hypothetical protein